MHVIIQLRKFYRPVCFPRNWKLIHIKLLYYQLYGCETLSLTLREEHMLRVFENKVLRKIFGAKRDEITGERRELHNAELHAQYSLPNIIRNLKFRWLRWAGHVAHIAQFKNSYRVLVGKPEGKKPLGRPRHRWENNIKLTVLVWCLHSPVSGFRMYWGNSFHPSVATIFRASKTYATSESGMKNGKLIRANPGRNISKLECSSFLRRWVRSKRLQK